MQMVFRAPGRYIQKEGAINDLNGFVASFGGNGMLILTEGSYERYGKAMEDSAQNSAITLSHVIIGRETTQSEIDAAAEAIRTAEATVVVGIGGGKALDTARAAAEVCRCALIIIPTVASNDAPCSALSIIHDEEGNVLELRVMHRNPDIVLVDTGILIHAPERLLVAGMGDALATHFEAEACHLSGASTLAGAQSSDIALNLAALCYDTLIAYGSAALRACETGLVNDDFERVVQACIFMSGVGFESGGVAGAHAINDGFSACPEAAHLYHGEIVGFGTLSMLMLQKAEEETVNEVAGFMKEVGLPMTFAQLGIEPTEAFLMKVADTACTKSVMGNMPFEVTPADVIRAMLKADLVGQAKLAEAAAE